MINIKKGYEDWKELEKIVLSGKLTGGEEFAADEEIDILTVIGIITGACIFTVLLCWSIFALRNRKRRN